MTPFLITSSQKFPAWLIGSSSDHSTAQPSWPLNRNWQRFVEDRHLTLAMVGNLWVHFPFLKWTRVTVVLKSKRSWCLFFSFSPSLNGEDPLRCESILSGEVLCLHSQEIVIKCPVSLNHGDRQARLFRTLGPNCKASLSIWIKSIRCFVCNFFLCIFSCCELPYIRMAFNSRTPKRKEIESPYAPSPNDSADSADV